MGAFIIHGSLVIFFEGSIAKGIWVIIFLLLVPPQYSHLKTRRPADSKVSSKSEP